jgi:hypothetical protein
VQFLETLKAKHFHKAVDGRQPEQWRRTMFKVKFAALTTRIGTTTTFAMALASVLLLSGTALPTASAESLPSRFWVYCQYQNYTECTIQAGRYNDQQFIIWGPGSEKDAHAWMSAYCRWIGFARGQGWQCTS